MRKTLLSAVLLLMANVVTNAQILRADELETYAKKNYGEKWTEAAEKLSKDLKLDKNKSLTYVQVVEAPGKTKEQLYVALNYWYTTTFKDGKSVIQLNDKEEGVIIAKGFVAGIAHHVGGMNHYNVNLTPIIKTDIKNGKIRITYTVPFYPVVKLEGGGIMGLIGNADPIKVHENWLLDECFPFAKKDAHKKTSSKALVMAHAYSNVIMDKIEEAVKNGVVGNEDDDW